MGTGEEGEEWWSVYIEGWNDGNATSRMNEMTILPPSVTFGQRRAARGGLRGERSSRCSLDARLAKRRLRVAVVGVEGAVGTGV